MRCTAAKGVRSDAHQRGRRARSASGGAASDQTAPPVLIIGYGNLVREDDGLGCHAARRLGELLDERRARVIEAAQLMPEHAEDASRCALLILIDACKDAPAGHIHCRPIEPRADAPGAGQPITHHLDPQGLLDLARALYGASPRAFVFTVGGAAFGYGEGLSPAVKRSFEELIARIMEAVGSLGGAGGASEAAAGAADSGGAPQRGTVSRRRERRDA
jgi:hydrogenase maturation protease